MKILNTKKWRQAERGNVLFLILIAVALFAALSYAVTQSTRTGGGSGDNETALISSAQLTQYPASLRTAVVRMLIGGVDVSDLEFNPPTDFANCMAGTSNKFCVFHPNGGGATHTNAPSDFMASTGGNTAGKWYFNMENEIYEVGTSGAVAGTPETGTVELIAFLPGITETLCRRINEELGLAAAPVAETGIDISSEMVNTNGSTKFGICNGGCGDTIGEDQTALNGQPYGCFTQDWDATAPTDYVYYHVLVER